MSLLGHISFPLLILVDQHTSRPFTAFSRSHHRPRYLPPIRDCLFILCLCGVSAIQVSVSEFFTAAAAAPNPTNIKVFFILMNKLAPFYPGPKQPLTLVESKDAVVYSHIKYNKLKVSCCLWGGRRPTQQTKAKLTKTKITKILTYLPVLKQ